MISIGFSLEQLLDSLAEHRGLSREELVDCIKDAIVETFRLRGRVVIVEVEDVEAAARISVQEMILTGSQPFYREVNLVPPVAPDLLTQIIEEAQQRKAANHIWSLSETRVVRVEKDHYLLELIGPVDLPTAEGKVAVLPRRDCNQADAFAMGDNIWVGFKPNVSSSVDGGHVEPWRDVEAPYIATRSESNFLTLMAIQMLGEAVQGVIHTSRGILIFPAGTDIQPLLAEGGKHKNILQRLCGLSRLAIARRSPREEIDKRMIHAINEVAGLKYGVDYRIGAEDPTQLPRVYVSHEKAKQLIGAGGHNLFFLKCVVQTAFDVKVTAQITRSSKPARRPGNR
ncbi:hypothetical protein RQP54_18390 [Curvibacter sp. APW13]|uniref:hypothetical protein n=1 Tax=Curvibacter sp. APW13 TaxID=3077236 RepID=UPI0028DE26B9|nr:hypothetical protein [Curvibacter sp. APW13]MDT8992849.1 hypothetical protein [Curvibacter sp. APW13]